MQNQAHASRGTFSNGDAEVNIKEDTIQELKNNQELTKDGDNT